MPQLSDGRVGPALGFFCALCTLVAASASVATAAVEHSPAAPTAPVPPTLPAAAPATDGAPASQSIVVDVYTMGPGDYFFSLFGHAAVCVTDEQSPAGRCYNWGTADFSEPVRLAWQVARGRAQFWVGTMGLPRLISSYIGEDRSIYRQRLRLSPDAAQRIVQRLHTVDERSHSLYTYHNIRDNCTTRVRDLVDDATDGGLSKNPAVHRADQVSFRGYSLEGFAGRPYLLAGSLLFFGRAIDVATTRHAGMFLPRVLREEIARQLHIEPELIYTRRGPSPSGPASDGNKLLLGAGLLLAVCALLLARGRRTWQSRFLIGGPLGAIGTLLFLLLVLSPLRELRYNEVLLLCWPSDLFLPLVPYRLMRRYQHVRLAACGLVAIAAALGLLRQPLLGPLLFVVPLLLTAWASTRWWPHDRRDSSTIPATVPSTIPPT